MLKMSTQFKVTKQHCVGIHYNKDATFFDLLPELNTDIIYFNIPFSWQYCKKLASQDW